MKFADIPAEARRQEGTSGVDTESFELSAFVLTFMGTDGDVYQLGQTDQDSFEGDETEYLAALVGMDESNIGASTERLEKVLTAMFGDDTPALLGE